MTWLLVTHIQSIIVLLQLEIYEVCIFGGVEEDGCCGSVLSRMEREEVGWWECGKGIAGQDNEIVLTLALW